MVERPLRRLLALLSILASWVALSQDTSRFLAGYDEVQPILNALADVVPSELKDADRTKWSDWVVRHHQDIRARLAGGDEDTLVNWLLFGTSFTRQPRALLDVDSASEALDGLISKRLKDLVSALASTDQDERRVLARQLLRTQGYRFDTAGERTRLEQHFKNEVERVLAEQNQYRRELDAALLSGDVAKRVAAESRLFRDRGISLDTSIFPGFAVEQALNAIRQQDGLAPNSIRRVAIVGPGLDFSDKNSGYDFYPMQTLQPFTLMDSLLRLGLASQGEVVEVTTFDISSRVNNHINALQNRGKDGQSYELRLPFEAGSSWTGEFRKYWEGLGNRVGTEIAVSKPPSIGKRLDARGIRVRPQLAARVTAVDFNIVTERWDGPPFDMVIATNILFYYDRFDQALAFSGIEAMLRPGGLFLTNNAVVELPVSRLRAKGFVTAEYSRELAWIDHVFWYVRH